mgnify:CR=1 FL=1
MKTRILFLMCAKKIILYILSGIVLLFLIFLLYFTLSEYDPEREQVIENNNDAKIIRQKTFHVLIWNIGYCGLGADMSFFYDGGDQVRTSKENTIKNMHEIIEILDHQRNFDFILLQEVDLSSKRSYYIDQFNHINHHLNDLSGYFVKNYDVQFVPIPFRSPLGKVKSGLATFSRFTPKKVTRRDFPGEYSWPKRVFMLDRCFLVLRYPLPNDKELLIVNTHNSAYDNGKLKEQEMSYLREFLLREYNKGNYIISGGDWNQYPPGINNMPEIISQYELEDASVIEDDLMPPGWKWMFDAKIPTNRSLKEPFNKATQTGIIDFYLLSPNINGLKVKTTDLNFSNSDHQPVSLSFTID